MYVNPPLHYKNLLLINDLHIDKKFYFKNLITLNNTNTFKMHTSFKLAFIFTVMCSLHSVLNGQDLLVEGTAKIETLTLDNNADQVLVLLANGNIGVRDVSTITGGGGGSSNFIVGGAASNNGFDNGTDNFMPMGSGTVRSDVIANVDSRVPMDGTLSMLEGGINGSTTGTDYTFTVYKNGTPTAITCTVSSGSVTCTDLSNSVQFCTGDRIAVNYVGDDDGTNSDNRVGRWIALFTPNPCP